MGGLFGSAPKPPPPLPPVPTPEDPAVEQRRRDVRQALKRRRGRGATILTSPLGDTSTPETKRKRLLGGGE